jgi:pimeloyl-ACP methyl ester carboxylesterase
MSFYRQRETKNIDQLRSPNLWWMLLEGRAPLEYAASLLATPWLRGLPAGDGHPVLVFPGLGAGDLSTAPLRRFLKARGYTPYRWKQGSNFGPRSGVLRACHVEADEIFKRHQRPVSLIGWSLGGIYAREVAKELPGQTRCVITLGTPFTGNPRATNAWRVYRLLSGQKSHDPSLIEQIREAPPVPTTSIYSRSDGIVAWQCSLNVQGPITENIEVPASHVGMGLNPMALYAIADRLAQDPQAWRHFEVSGARRWFFRTGVAQAAA